MAWSGDGKFVKIEQRPQDRIGLVCDTGLEVQLIDVRRRYPASIGKKIIYSAKKCV